jgi:hypothetical protein
MTTHMRDLQEVGLYRPLDPSLGHGSIELAAIERELAQALAQIPLEDLMPPGPQQNLDDQSNTLHADKLDPAIARDLIRRGLVRETPAAPWRLIASPTLLNIVVSIIANSIARGANVESGCTGRMGLRPHTDVPNAHRLGVLPIAGHDVTGCWQVDLSPLLPVPRDDVMVTDVLDFRRRYDDERSRMMTAIDDLLHGLSQVQRHPQDAFGKVKREMAQAVDDLHRAARASKIAWVVRPLTVAVAVAADASASFMSPEAGIPLSVASTIGAIMVNVATNQIRHESTGTVNPADYRYLHLVQTSLGLTSPGQL